MRAWSPLKHALSTLGLEVRCRFKLGDAHACALQAAEPLLHLIHPGAGARRKVHATAGGLHSPVSHVLAVMRAAMIAHAMHRCAGLVTRRLPLFKKDAELLLTLACVTLPKARSRAGVDGGRER
jgi:hypothetical protein